MCESLVAFAADARLHSGLGEAFCSAYECLLGRHWQAVASSQAGIEQLCLGLTIWAWMTTYRPRSMSRPIRSALRCWKPASWLGSSPPTARRAIS